MNYLNLLLWYLLLINSTQTFLTGDTLVDYGVYIDGYWKFRTFGGLQCYGSTGNFFSFWELCALVSIWNNVLDKSIVVVLNKSKETHKRLSTVLVLTLSKIGTKFDASLQMFYTPDSCVEICLTKGLPYWYLLWSGEPGLAGHPAKRLLVWFQMNHALKVSIFPCLCYRRSSGQPAHKQKRCPHCKILELFEIQTCLKHQQCLQFTIWPTVSNAQRQRPYFISVLLL